VKRRKRRAPITAMTEAIPFDELTAEQQALAGGKGGTLARLYQVGYPVPDGVVILSAAFEGDELSPDAWGVARSHLARLRKGNKDLAFAIRSSALSEDSAQSSFAGEFQTVLNARTDEQIREAVRTVHQSRVSRRVQVYSRAKGLDETHKVAVVIQRMVKSDISGVLFTVDPITGNRRVMAGSFIEGVGENLVSGKATGEAFTLERHNGRYQGPAKLQPHARRLYKLAHRLEGELGCPQDIEWAIAGGKLFILQSRPITTLQGYNPSTGECNDSLTGDYLWSNVNFGEAISEVMTPLTWSVIQFTLDDWVFIRNLPSVGNIGGRPYLNSSVFASLLEAMGKKRKDLLQALEAILYMRLPNEMEIPTVPLAGGSFLSSLLNSIRVRWNQRRGLRALKSYLETNSAWFRQTQERIRGMEDPASLLRLWQQEMKPHLKRGVWCVLGSVDHSANYTMQLRRELSELIGPDDANELIANLRDSSGSLASLGPVMGMAKVGRGEMSRQAYLEEYGHRGPHEFELSVPHPAEDPRWFEAELENYQKSPVDIDALLRKQRQRFNAAWGRLETRWPRKTKAIGRRIAESARRARLREAARSEYVRDRWAVRLFAKRAGELTGLGNDIFFLTLSEVLGLLAGEKVTTRCISARKETWLRYKSLPPYPPVIRGRFDPFKWAADPQRRGDVFDAQVARPTGSSEQHTSNIIMGSSGSAGQVEGFVRVLANPEAAHQFQTGEILVAIQTDIAWTLLFPRAAAIITDVGAPLSHAAIVARELGIPAVVGCGDSTMRLKTGDRVRVNGGRGLVEILQAGHARK